MISKQLQKAREFEKEHIGKILPKERPAYHVTGGSGWINDPNGFSYYQGEYHVFHQYHPYSNAWGPMHWGHLVSRDLISWERRPAVMAPDTDYDGAGCFSGSAVTLPDGRQLLMYTGVAKTLDGGVRQTQCLAVGDGTDYEKYGENPVISGKDLPEGGSLADFRDPKIWQEDGRYYAVATNALADGNSAILLYESEDAFHWKYAGEIDRSDRRLGGMWECPDFFQLDGKQILLVSPMAMMPEGLKYHVGHSVLCISGAYDKEKRRFTREDVQPVDGGIDFYAPQTLEAPDGRRIMIAWMQSWSNSKFPPKGFGYFGQMTVPRELSFVDGKLIQKPVRELEAYRGTGVRHEEVVISEETSLEGVRGRVADLTVELTVDGGFREFALKVACDEDFETLVAYDAERQVLVLDRSHSGYLCDIVHRRELAVAPVDGKVTLRCLLDRYSLEVFINGGEQTATTTLYTRTEADEIRFSASGKAKVSVEMYELKLA